MVAGSSSYTSVTVTNIGTGYAVNDTITIQGASLGGSTPTNNLTITVTSLDGDILDGSTSGVKTLTITSQAQAASFGVGPQTTTPVNDGMNPSLNDNPIKTVSVASGTSTGSATFTNVTGTVSSGNGSGAKFTITTDGSGGYSRRCYRRRNSLFYCYWKRGTNYHYHSRTKSWRSNDSK